MSIQAPRLFVFMFAVSSLAVLSDATLADAPRVEPVLTLDVASDRMHRLTKEPVLSIYADGRVEMPAVYPHSVDVVGRLTGEELDVLIRFVAVDQDFFGIDPAAPTSAGRPGRRLPVHAPPITLAVDFGDRRQVITFRSVGRDDGALDPRLAAIHSRLQSLMARVQVGGADGLQTILDAANQQLASSAGGGVRFTAGDLTAGKRRPDGSIYATLQRTADKETWSATVEMGKAGSARVSVGSDRGQRGARLDRAGESTESSHGSGSAVTFAFFYEDPPGVGFNDTTTLGSARREALERAGAILASMIQVDSPVTIQVTVDGSETTDGKLASAGSFYTSADAQACAPGFGNRGDVGLKLVDGIDVTPDTFDAFVVVNFEDPLWGLGDDVAGNENDFLSVMLHELVHTLGLAASINEDGTDLCGTPVGQPGSWVPFDEFIGDSIGFLIDNDFIVENDWFISSVGGPGDNGILWLGPQGTAANGGASIPMYSPTEFAPGSSISHLDDEVFGQTFLMESIQPLGPYVRSLSAIEVAMLRDIGLDIVFRFDYAGDSDGNWVSIEEGFAGNGQGLALDYLPFADLLFVAWFTYVDPASANLAAGPDTVGSLDNRWLTGQLSIDGNVATGPLFASTGGLFDQPPQPGQQTAEVGTMTIEFTACDAATMSYNIAGTTLTRDFPIVPLEKRLNPGFRCASEAAAVQ